MSASREYRNAANIEEAAGRIGSAIDLVAQLDKDLGPFLPDDWQPIDDEIGALYAAHERLMDRIGA